LAPSGAFAPIAELADAPIAIALEDGGALLVTVPDAVLRVRPSAAQDLRRSFASTKGPG
jgi:hypothetical protein